MTKRKQTNAIVIHCSATRPSQDIGVADIRKWHKARGWKDVGYHFVIRRNGLIELGRSLDEQGAHVAGRNFDTVGICLVGGLFEDGSEGNERTQFDQLFTPSQQDSLYWLIWFLLRVYPDVKIFGHRDLSPDKNKDGKVTPNEWTKTCPGFDVGEYLL